MIVITDEGEHEEAGFLEEWERCRSQLWRRMLKMTRSPDAADDLLQEVFVRVYPRRTKLGPGEVGKYSSIVARNTTIEYLVRQQRLEYDVPEQTYRHTPYDAYALQERHAYQSMIHEAIARLPPRHQQAVDAFLAYERRSDAARAIGIPTTTLRARQQQAVKRLRRQLLRRKPTRDT